MIYYLHGKSGDIEGFDIEEYRRPVAYVVTECYQEKHATVWEKLKHNFANMKKHLEPAKKTTTEKMP